MSAPRSIDQTVGTSCLLARILDVILLMATTISIGMLCTISPISCNLLTMGNTAIVTALTTGPHGRFMHGLRDDPHAAVGIGIQPLRVYIGSFILAGAVAGISGAINASYASYISPNVFGPDVSILLMAMVLLGGAATRLGPLLGAGLLLAVPEVVRLAGSGTATVGAINYIAMGCVLTVFAIVRPRGVLGGYEFQ